MKSNYQIKSTIILQNLELETILESSEKQWYVDIISSARASMYYQNFGKNTERGGE